MVLCILWSHFEEENSWKLVYFNLCVICRWNFFEHTHASGLYIYIVMKKLREKNLLRGGFEPTGQSQTRGLLYQLSYRSDRLRSEINQLETWRFYNTPSRARIRTTLAPRISLILQAATGSTPNPTIYTLCMQCNLTSRRIASHIRSPIHPYIVMKKLREKNLLWGGFEPTGQSQTRGLVHGIGR